MNVRRASFLVKTLPEKKTIFGQNKITTYFFISS